MSSREFSKKKNENVCNSNGCCRDRIEKKLADFLEGLTANECDAFIDELTAAIAVALKEVNQK